MHNGCNNPGCYTCAYEYFLTPTVQLKCRAPSTGWENGSLRQILLFNTGVCVVYATLEETAVETHYVHEDAPSVWSVKTPHSSEGRGTAPSALVYYSLRAQCGRRKRLCQQI